jgi:hypothetical protein
VKVAVTAAAEVIVTVHEVAPLQAPPHVLKFQPEDGTSVSVTLVPAGYA